MSLFALAVDTAKPTVKKGAVKMRTLVPVALGDKLSKLQRVRNELADLKAQEADLVDDIKPVAKEQFLALYNANKSVPENFILQSDDGGKMMVIVQDKYLTLTPDKEAVLKEVWADKAGELIKTEVGFTFNATILAKYEKEISAAIMAADIPDEAKVGLIVPDIKKSVAKGVIKRLFAYDNPDTLFELIQPIIQLKNQDED